MVMMMDNEGGEREEVTFENRQKDRRHDLFSGSLGYEPTRKKKKGDWEACHVLEA